MAQPKIKTEQLEYNIADLDEIRNGNDVNLNNSGIMVMDFNSSTNSVTTDNSLTYVADIVSSSGTNIQLEAASSTAFTTAFSLLEETKVEPNGPITPITYYDNLSNLRFRNHSYKIGFTTENTVSLSFYVNNTQAHIYSSNEIPSIPYNKFILELKYSAKRPSNGSNPDPIAEIKLTNMYSDPTRHILSDQFDFENDVIMADTYQRTSTMICTHTSTQRGGLQIAVRRANGIDPIQVIISIIIRKLQT